MGNFFSDIGDKLESAWDKVEKQADRSWEDVREFNYKAIPYIQAVSQYIPHPAAQVAAQAHGMLWGGYDDGKGGGEMPNDQVIMIDPRYNVGSLPLGVGALPPGTGGYVPGGDWTAPEPEMFTSEWIKKYQPALLIGGGILLFYLIK